jgi:hypothetical protein
MWTESDVVCFKADCIPGISVEGLRKTKKWFSGSGGLSFNPPSPEYEAGDLITVF